MSALLETINPVEPFLRSDRMPHIWCRAAASGHGQLFRAGAAGKPAQPGSRGGVSGIGCTGRVAGYVKLDSFHTRTGGHSVRHRAEAGQPVARSGVYRGTATCSPSAAITSFTRPGATWISR